MLPTERPWKVVAVVAPVTDDENDSENVVVSLSVKRIRILDVA
jgi:hypothetical protein